MAIKKIRDNDFTFQWSHHSFPLPVHQSFFRKNKNWKKIPWLFHDLPSAHLSVSIIQMAMPIYFNFHTNKHQRNSQT